MFHQANKWVLSGIRTLVVVVFFAFLILAARPIVPAYMAAQRDTIVSSAERHGIKPDVLAAIFYNEMLGQEQRFVDIIVPGDNVASEALREGLLGWHFMTLKRAQWTFKGVVALLGSNVTVGPTGIRVSVGREIRSEVTVVGGRYQASGLAERPLLVMDLMDTPTAIEYLAANLERGMRRAPQGQAGDWTVLARWHNTGLTADRPDVPRRLWDKGTRYVARVQSFLPEVAAMLNRPPAPPLFRVLGLPEAAQAANRRSDLLPPPAMVMHAQ